ncbi:MAG TPA: hypothetical protein VJ783_11330 [Pirellulales bacterium]|nr:hypothetical protein [Pirellulales bacterium]
MAVAMARPQFSLKTLLWLTFVVAATCVAWTTGLTFVESLVVAILAVLIIAPRLPQL